MLRRQVHGAECVKGPDLHREVRKGFPEAMTEQRSKFKQVITRHSGKGKSFLGLEKSKGRLAGASRARSHGWGAGRSRDLPNITVQPGSMVGI